MAQICAEVTLTDVVESVRSGGVVRVVNETEAKAGKPAAGYLVLAAEMASIDALQRLLQLTDSLPVFATTRDRLEQLQIVEVPVADEQQNGKADRHFHVHDDESLVDRAKAAARLAAASASLLGGDRELAKHSLSGLTVRCTDWGGVVNCQRVFEAAVDLSRLAGLLPVALVWRLSAKRAANLEATLREELLELPTMLIRQLVAHRRAQMSATLLRNGPCVRMPTRHGNFTLQAYEDTLTGQLHLAFWTGQLSDPCLVRVHSECLTGDLFGSLRCDCGTQLDLALARLAQEGDGALIYLRQEGRGIGLVNKLRTYAIQDQGFDTVEANQRIGFDADLRDYSLAAEILNDLGISTVRLLTNNPLKVRGLKMHGIRVADRVPLVVDPCPENSAYLDAKRTKMGHWLS